MPPQTYRHQKQNKEKKKKKKRHTKFYNTKNHFELLKVQVLFILALATKHQITENITEEFVKKKKKKKRKEKEEGKKNTSLLLKVLLEFKCSCNAKHQSS